jgi:hypothetical protein
MPPARLRAKGPTVCRASDLFAWRGDAFARWRSKAYAASAADDRKAIGDNRSTFFQNFRQTFVNRDPGCRHRTEVSKSAGHLRIDRSRMDGLTWIATTRSWSSPSVANPKGLRCQMRILDEQFLGRLSVVAQSPSGANPGWWFPNGEQTGNPIAASPAVRNQTGLAPTDLDLTDLTSTGLGLTDLTSTDLTSTGLGPTDLTSTDLDLTDLDQTGLGRTELT